LKGVDRLLKGAGLRSGSGDFLAQAFRGRKQNGDKNVFSTKQLQDFEGPPRI